MVMLVIAVVELWVNSKSSSSTDTAGLLLLTSICGALFSTVFVYRIFAARVRMPAAAAIAWLAVQAVATPFLGYFCDTHWHDTMPAAVALLPLSEFILTLFDAQRTGVIEMHLFVSFVVLAGFAACVIIAALRGMAASRQRFAEAVEIVRQQERPAA
jgi:hypothetical protein